MHTHPRKHVLIDHADYTVPTRQHELDHARLGIDYISALKDLDHDLCDG